jgi:hypothetical protein
MDELKFLDTSVLLRWFPAFLVCGCCLCPQVSGAAEITITHLLESDAWNVEYQLPRPVQELIFVRKQSAFRSTSWELSEGDVEFGRKGDYEIVRGSAGESFDSFSIVAPSLPQLLPKDHSQNYLFTDGSHLLLQGTSSLLKARLAPSTTRFV